LVLSAARATLHTRREGTDFPKAVIQEETSAMGDGATQFSGCCGSKPTRHLGTGPTGGAKNLMGSSYDTHSPKIPQETLAIENRSLGNFGLRVELPCRLET
jgi:hypothetical protein